TSRSYSCLWQIIADVSHFDFRRYSNTCRFLRGQCVHREQRNQCGQQCTLYEHRNHFLGLSNGFFFLWLDFLANSSRSVGREAACCWFLAGIQTIKSAPISFRTKHDRTDSHRTNE
uniref:Uncharacterized protein n=1 Tax=Anopheles arabiensis TaxID=7173 RepID=A0A182IH25_ANOAR